MGILKRWYQSATRHTNLYKFCKRNQPVSYSFLMTLHYKSTQDIDLTSCDFGGIRNIHTESQSEMEAWEAMVDYSKLSETDLKIHQRHVAANKVHIFSQIFAYSNLEKKNEILCEDLFSNFSQLIHEQKSLKMKIEPLSVFEQ